MPSDRPLSTSLGAAADGGDDSTGTAPASREMSSNLGLARVGPKKKTATGKSSDAPRPANTANGHHITCADQERGPSLQADLRLAKHRRRVAFRPSVNYREIPSRATLTSRDIDELWFSGQDFDLNKAECRSTVKKMRKLLRRHSGEYSSSSSGANALPIQSLLTSFDDEEMTIRGLEHLRSKSVLDELRQQKLQITHAVLYAQDRGGRRDAIAAISQKFSTKARERALQVGRQDAIDAWQGEQDVAKVAAAAGLGSQFHGRLGRILEESVERK